MPPRTPSPPQQQANGNGRHRKRIICPRVSVLHTYVSMTLEARPLTKFERQGLAAILDEIDCDTSWAHATDGSCRCRRTLELLVPVLDPDPITDQAVQRLPDGNIRVTRRLKKAALEDLARTADQAIKDAMVVLLELETRFEQYRRLPKFRSIYKDFSAFLSHTWSSLPKAFRDFFIENSVVWKAMASQEALQGSIRCEKQWRGEEEILDGSLMVKRRAGSGSVEKNSLDDDD